MVKGKNNHRRLYCSSYSQRHDGILTLWELRLSAIEEVNPVMRWLIEETPIALWSSNCRCH